jgi:hypothetical protein
MGEPQVAQVIGESVGSVHEHRGFEFGGREKT